MEKKEVVVIPTMKINGTHDILHTHNRSSQPVFQAVMLPIRNVWTLNG